MNAVGPPNRIRRVRVRRRRSPSFLLSAAVHGALLGAVAFGPPPSGRSKRPIYDELIRPNEKKIIWYRKLPEIAPKVKVGDTKDPRGNVKSPTTTIALSPKPISAKQIVLQPAPEIKLDHDIPAPNLIGLRPPAPPLPPVKVARKFVAPSIPKRDGPVLTEPEATLTWTEPGGISHSITTVRPKRAFIAPPKPDESKAAHPVVLESAPELGSEGAAQLSKLPGVGVTTKVPSRRYVPPSGNSSTGVAGGAGGRVGGKGVDLDAPPELRGTANLNAAIIGLNPTDRLVGPIPPGNRPGEFSAAPTVGKTSTGDVKGSGGAAMPGLMVKDGKADRSDPRGAGNASPGSKIARYDDLVAGSVRPALSAPLRPSSRTIPQALDARFRGRLVYTIVIPVPNLPAYTSDWIIWFAEQAPRTEVPRMRAPVPLQKMEPVDAAPPPYGRAETRIQLSAIIKASGKIESVTLVKGSAGATSQAAIEDLKRWEFRPALRDGAPIDVEAVFEIPFSLPWLTGSP